MIPIMDAIFYVNVRIFLVNGYFVHRWWSFISHY